MNGTSDRTKRVLELIAKGVSAAVVAERLGIRRQRVHSIVSEDRLRREKLSSIRQTGEMVTE